jgi:hypothetical protein
MDSRSTNMTKNCPVCKSVSVVEGKIIEGGSEYGWAHKFYPRGVRFFSLRRSVHLLNGEAFQACTQCGHVWGTLDATDLRDLIESKGTDMLKVKLK